MTIGIDIRVLGNKVKSGIEEYAENLIPHLLREGRDVAFKLFYSSHKNSLSNYDWLNEPNAKLYRFNYPNNLLFAYSRIFKRPFLDRMVGGADVFLFPHFFISSLSPSCKRVTTFHDLSYVHFPEFLTLRKKIWHNFQMIPEWQVKFSDKVIAVSESTKNDLTNFYKVDPARVEVIYSGITSDVQGTSLGEVSKACVAASRISVDVADGVRNFKHSKNLPERFIFFLGKLEPRKNIISLIKAFNNLKSNPKYNNVGLVIAGAKGWLCDELFKESKRSVHHRQIIFTDQLTDKERFLYYRAADVFVYPSFFEGFGFPPLEAMSCGVPVITSRNSSLPEVVANSAIMVDPYDVNELELWITRLLDNKDFSNLMTKKGVEQASKFNWKNTAIRTLEVLIKA